MVTVKRNLAYQGSFQVLNLLAPLATAPYVSRVLGAEGLGLSTYTVGVAQYFALFALFGIQNHGRREIARVRDTRGALDHTFSSLVTFHGVMSIASVVGYAMFVMFLGGGARTIFAIQGLWVVAAFFDVSWLFAGMEDFKLIALRNACVKVLTIASIFIFVRTADDLWIYVLILAFGALFGQLCIWPRLRRHVDFVRPSWLAVRAHFWPSFMMFLPGLAVSFYKIANKVFLGGVAGAEPVGLFAAADKMVEIPMALVGAFGMVMLPRMSNVLATGRSDEGERLLATSFRYTSLVCFALTFGLAGIAVEFMPIFFGSDFSGAGRLLVVLAMAVPFMSLASVLRTQVLIPRSMDRQLVLSLVFGAVVSVVASVALIPRHHALGAVVAVLLAEVAGSLAQVALVRKTVPIGRYLRSGSVFVVIGLTMFALLRMLASVDAGPWAIVVQIAVGATFYLGASAVFLWSVRDPAFAGFMKSIKSKVHGGRS